MNHLLKPKEVAKQLNISCSKVYNLVQEARLPVIRIGKTLRFNQADLDKFLK